MKWIKFSTYNKKKQKRVSTYSKILIHVTKSLLKTISYMLAESPEKLKGPVQCYNTAPELGDLHKIPKMHRLKTLCINFNLSLTYICPQISHAPSCLMKYSR